mgnify:FL=1
MAFGLGYFFDSPEKELPAEAIITNKMANHCQSVSSSPKITKAASDAMAGSRLIIILKP